VRLVAIICTRWTQEWVLHRWQVSALDWFGTILEPLAIPHTRMLEQGIACIAGAFARLHIVAFAKLPIVAIAMLHIVALAMIGAGAFSREVTAWELLLVVLLVGALFRVELVAALFRVRLLVVLLLASVVLLLLLLPLLLLHVGFALLLLVVVTMCSLHGRAVGKLCCCCCGLLLLLLRLLLLLLFILILCPLLGLVQLLHMQLRKAGLPFLLHVLSQILPTIVARHSGALHLSIVLLLLLLLQLLLLVLLLLLLLLQTMHSRRRNVMLLGSLLLQLLLLHLLLHRCISPTCVCRFLLLSSQERWVWRCWWLHEGNVFLLGDVPW